MIKLTRLDGSEFFLNPDLIESIEETPDTRIRLSNEDRFLVLEKAATIIEKIIAYKATVLRRAASAPTRRYLKGIRRREYPLTCALEEKDA
ncbi:flagellar protein FlbD [Geotalea uraniireducens]|uniref:Flagellar protein FlbD n=1 Tax=Geotalea uraniireducens TaxID=351604 RepID=A0ABN6VX25_9BACT|nr:flagellar FlbD family protein [Geotalea uraniireducens]BDV44417.1 flagellar protein FlbD [Geotalea uraniireducens]